MRYDDRLLSGADPLYAPGMDQGRYWKAPARYVKAGYVVKRVRLEGSDLEKAARCRALTREMLEWYEGAEKVEAGTWQWLIGRYKGDEFSPFQEVKPITRATYTAEVAKMETGIGQERLADWNQVRIKQWHRGMLSEGRSVDYAKRQVTQLRIVVNYGAQIENAECARLAFILSKMEFPSPQPRQKAMTREQAEAIVAAADAAGHVSFGTAILLLFETGLRQVDVRGQWLDAGQSDGGISSRGKRWADGLTWDMIDADATTLRKITSKTGAEAEYNLLDLPVLRVWLKAMDRKAGPIFTMRDGTPYKTRYFSALFSRFREKAGVPEDVWLMDTRAGAITEAKAAGANPADIRDLAGHADIQTTNRYMRGRKDGTARVIKLRQERAS
ncbi:Phage integrase family protein [Gemmobacter megaterium]|uniref:Phage integrase family protein n=1 Tax=Gemmobacter megaterium TaxID=1086013 RepID=A0A1N7Q7S3_9RHOB|nr:tyrosine-type recombinase/integrase [Gemmobacter megaterium]GGE23820.1 hypothetical protein GCM10011345_32230 [Gemmobacter megaterium]SIT18884.1 Phage integrase family protein [Gemmobacter megaterium]